MILEKRHCLILKKSPSQYDTNFTFHIDVSVTGEMIYKSPPNIMKLFVFIQKRNVDSYVLKGHIYLLRFSN
jgi:hypothetical protein